MPLAVHLHCPPDHRMRTHALNPAPDQSNNQSAAIAGLLQNMVQVAGVRAPVSVSVDNVEAPLLTGPDGDVVRHLPNQTSSPLLAM